MKFAAFFAFCLFSLAGLAAEHPKEYYDPDVQRLIAVDRFAFGPSGYEAQLSVGERAFAAIVKKKEAIRCLLQVFQHGTPEARCYAMVALREYSSDLFAECVTTFRVEPPPTIRIMEGSIASEVPSLKLLDSINRGFYRRYFTQHEEADAD